MKEEPHLALAAGRQQSLQCTHLSPPPLALSTFTKQLSFRSLAAPVLQHNLSSGIAGASGRPHRSCVATRFTCPWGWRLGGRSMLLAADKQRDKGRPGPGILKGGGSPSSRSSAKLVRLVREGLLLMLFSGASLRGRLPATCAYVWPLTSGCRAGGGGGIVCWV